MSYIKKIILLAACTSLGAEMLPENGAQLNYTQIFFRWDQIPGVESYQFTIQNMENGEESQLNISQNSVLLTEFINWNSTYTWFICGLFTDNSTPFCSEIYSLDINPLPDYFPNTDNLFIDETLYQDGVTVMDFESLNFSGGINRYGIPIWFVERNNFDIRFTFTQFLPNGNVVGFEPAKGLEIDLNGNIIFETPFLNSLHHQITKTSNNTYFLISATIENQYYPEECQPSLPDEIPWQGDTFREFDQDGNEIWSWSTFDHYDLTEYNPYYVEIYSGNQEMDWTHSNSVFFDKNSESVFVSVRNLSRITKIDYASKNLVWNMGNTDFMNEIYFDEDLNFSQQHSVQVLDNGNLLFFDNHRYLTPELSRCMEVSYDESDYSVDVVWEFILPENMFTGSRGECDRLENGNTLITAGRSGHILEVTHEHEIAWHLEYDHSGTETTSYRSERIPNLHPIAFSFSLDNISGSVENPQVTPINGMLTAHIHNNSWGDGWYHYRVNNESGVEILSDSLFVLPFVDTMFDINTNGLEVSNSILTLEINPSLAIEKMQSFTFTLNTSILLGDVNGDGGLNILDVVQLVQGILGDGLDGDINTPGNQAWAGDTNQDGGLNILDVVTLVNMILD